MQDFLTLSPHPTSSLLQNLYARMLLARTVDDYARSLCEEHHLLVGASCRGHEAAQVGSAVCIEVGKDFTLPYYRDLGVVLTIGMTPYEVFRTYLQTRDAGPYAQTLHWGYRKHNTITGTVPVATQMLHAAGIAFASKLRKTSAVTVAYCGDGAMGEPDFLEGVRFAALHHLPVIFICEQDCTHGLPGVVQSRLSTHAMVLPEGLARRQVGGSDVLTVYTAMQEAMQEAREGRGPLLLEVSVMRPSPGTEEATLARDPLFCCRQALREYGLWDDAWASQLSTRITVEVEQALRDALRDTSRQMLEG